MIFLREGVTSLSDYKDNEMIEKTEAELEKRVDEIHQETEKMENEIKNKASDKREEIEEHDENDKRKSDSTEDTLDDKDTDANSTKENSTNQRDQQESQNSSEESEKRDELEEDGEDESDDELEESESEEENSEDDESEGEESEGDEESEEESDEENESEDEESEEEESDEEKSDDEKSDDEETSWEDVEEDVNKKEEEKNEDEKDKSKDDEKKTNSEDRRKLGPKKQDNKLDLDNYKKSPSMIQKGANALQRKSGAAKDNVAMRVGQIKSAIGGALSAIKGVALGAIKLIVNPVFWITLGIIIAIALIVVITLSSMAVLGGNDYNKLCDHSGVGEVVIDEDVDDLTRQSAIASWLMSTPFKAFGDQPMSKEQAIAVIGNLKLESYMANPKAIGGIGDNNVEKWKTCNNDCIKNNTLGSNPIGLIQHLGGRRDQLISMAEEAGVQWYDLNIQLAHLKAELDGEGQPSNPTYEMNQVKKGFANPGQTIEEYTWLWQKDFERAGESKGSDEMALRQKYAKEFGEQFSGASASLSSQCSGGLAMSSNVTELAAQIAWTREEKAAKKGYGSCGANPGCGENFSKPEYIELKTKVEEETGRNGNNIKGLLASCDALVATLVRGAGIDTTIPYHNSNAQIAHMDDPKNGWERTSCQSRQPGDVFGKNGHIMIYVGEIDGKDTMVSASLQGGAGGPGRSAHMADISCQGELFRGDGMTVQGWRKVK